MRTYSSGLVRVQLLLNGLSRQLRFWDMMRSNYMPGLDIARPRCGLEQLHNIIIMPHTCLCSLSAWNANLSCKPQLRRCYRRPLKPPTSKFDTFATIWLTSWHLLFPPFSSPLLLNIVPLHQYVYDCWGITPSAKQRQKNKSRIELHHVPHCGRGKLIVKLCDRWCWPKRRSWDGSSLEFVLCTDISFWRRAEKHNAREL